MPSCARHQIIETDKVSTYHLVSRCVRRAFLCGVDKYSGKDFGHRRDWVESRLKDVVKNVFLLDLISHALMSNHLHFVVRMRPDLAAIISDEEIIRRWWALFPRKIKGSYALEPPQELKNIWLADSLWLAERRRRLTSISWFMSSICEYIARKANKEDRVTGRFWEGRFKSQILLDEKAVLSAATYVDLNPVRANVCKSLEESDFTSIQKRIAEFKENGSLPAGLTSGFLARFYKTLNTLETESPSLAIDPKDYIDICIWKASKLLNKNLSNGQKNEFTAGSLNAMEGVLESKLFSDNTIAKSKFAIGSRENVFQFAKKRQVNRPHFVKN